MNDEEWNKTLRHHVLCLGQPSLGHMITGTYFSCLCKYFSSLLKDHQEDSLVRNCQLHGLFYLSKSTEYITTTVWDFFTHLVLL